MLRSHSVSEPIAITSLKSKISILSIHLKVAQSTVIIKNWDPAGQAPAADWASFYKQFIRKQNAFLCRLTTQQIRRSVLYGKFGFLKWYMAYKHTKPGYCTWIYSLKIRRAKSVVCLYYPQLLQQGLWGDFHLSELRFTSPAAHDLPPESCLVSAPPADSFIVWTSCWQLLLQGPADVLRTLRHMWHCTWP